MVASTKLSLWFVAGVFLWLAIATGVSKSRKIQLQDDTSLWNVKDEASLTSFVDDKIQSLNRQKRMIFDSSCKGIYDRKLFGKLERVCDDCYNLFRKPSIATECRQDCFSQNDGFLFCVYELGYDVKEYEEYARLLRKKKDCYNNGIVTECLDKLFMREKVEEYISMILAVGKK